jgi:hypothetical protein
MIAAIGLDTDRTLMHFVAEAARRRTGVQVIDLRSIAEGDWRLSIPAGSASWVVAGGRRIDLDPEGSYFCRLTDLSSVIEEKAQAIVWRGLMAGLTAWLEAIPGHVINRPGHHADNSAKPLHEALLRRWGFKVPPSLTSSDGDRLRTFAAAGPTVVKAISGVRADCRQVGEDEFVNFSCGRGPVHLQRLVLGFDVRAHVVGDVVHAEGIFSDLVDYRIGDGECTFSEIDLPDRLREMVVATTRRLGLRFAGWDFKVTPDREFWCLEVNPMPGYNGYDVRLGGRITQSLIRALEGGRP